jgi:hypothetical protein
MIKQCICISTNQETGRKPRKCVPTNQEADRRPMVKIQYIKDYYRGRECGNFPSYLHRLLFFEAVLMIDAIFWALF